MADIAIHQPDNPLEAALTDFYAFGDMNADGMDDAAVIVWENTGGSGVFEFIDTGPEPERCPCSGRRFSARRSVKNQ